MTIKTLVAVLCVSYCLNLYESSEVILTGTNYTIKCQLEVELPSWTKLKTSTDPKYEITNYDYSSINPGYYAKERITYASNNRDLLLFNVILRDAGSYKCSRATYGEYTSTFYVDDLKQEVNCLDVGTSGNFSATTGCLELDVVTTKWVYELEDGTNVPIATDNITNTTGCSNGKSRLSSWFEHQYAYCLRSFKVRVKFFLRHNEESYSSDCGEYYVIEDCYHGWYISCIVLFAFHVISTILYWWWWYIFKKHKRNWILQIIPVFVHTIFLLLQIERVLELVHPPKPDASLEYDYRRDWIIFNFMIVLSLIVPSFVVIFWMCNSIKEHEA